MPNRIIKESARTSPTLAALSDAAERLFWRLVTMADDYGRFEADPYIVRGACVPILNWSIPKVARCLKEMTEAKSTADVPLLSYYFVGGRRFAQMNGWSRHQRPPRLASKYPDPPHVRSIPSEKNIHDRLFQHLDSTRLFCTYPILSLDRNVRAGNGFADLLINIAQGRILVELKRTRADMGAIKQVCNYRASIKEVVAVVILALGFGPTVGAGNFVKEGIALITYDENGQTSLSVSNSLITQCSDLVIPVNSRDLQQVPESISESREARDESGSRPFSLTTRKGRVGEPCPPEVAKKLGLSR